MHKKRKHYSIEDKYNAIKAIDSKEKSQGDII